MLREHILSSESPLPCREVVMSSSQNKRQLIKTVCDTPHGNPLLHLVGDDQCLFDHEEADVNIISYMLHLQANKSHIQIKADDTDIFLLLIYYVWKHDITTQISMKKKDGKIIDINATVRNLGNKCKDVLPLHALTGCDAVSYPYGKGKTTAANLLLKGDLHLEQMCDPSVSEDVVEQIGMDFLLKLYGGKPGSDLNQLRYQIFSRKKEPPKIKSLPPTKPSAIHHIKRARIQTLMWGAADCSAPPNVDADRYGWEVKQDQGLQPVLGPSRVAPMNVLKTVACSCKSTSPCSSNRCSCRSAGLSCTTYCVCDAADDCGNENNIKIPTHENSDDED